MDTVSSILFALVTGTLTFVLVFSLMTRDEVQIYMDPENNVVCYITSQNLQCFTYTDEGTHLKLN